MLVIAGAILVVLTLGTITLARAIGRATTVTLSPTTALSIPAGAAQGLSTFLVDGAYTYVANEGQHQIDVYVGGQWKRALQLPAEVMNVEQMAVLGSQLVVHYRTDQQRLVTLNLATGFPTFVDLAGAVPAAKLSPLSMRVDGSAVRISVLQADGSPSGTVAVLDVQGGLRASPTPTTITMAGEWTTSADAKGVLTLVHRDNSLKETQRVKLPEKPGSRAIAVLWDDTHVVVGVQLAKPERKQNYAYDVYNLTSRKWRRYLVDSTIVPSNVGPVFSVGQFQQYADGTVYEMVPTNAGVIIRRYAVGK
jgi:hypothetical protein